MKLFDLIDRKLLIPQWNVGQLYMERDTERWRQRERERDIAYSLKMQVFDNRTLITKYVWGSWVAQLVEHPTLDFGLGHDPMVMGSNPLLGSVLSVEPAWDPLSLFLCPPPCALFLSLK